MKFYFFFTYKSALHIAVEDKNIKVVQILLSQPNIDIKTTNEILFLFFRKFYFEINGLFLKSYEKLLLILPEMRK